MTDFPDSELMKNVFVINYPENSVYYKAPSAEEKHLLVSDPQSIPPSMCSNFSSPFFSLFFFFFGRVITSLLMAKEHYEEDRRGSTISA